VQEAGWAPEPVWTQRLEEKNKANVEINGKKIRATEDKVVPLLN
jgi:hypothetical protein